MQAKGSDDTTREPKCHYSEGEVGQGHISLRETLNVAYDDESCDVSDDEGQFMVQVDLGKPRKKSPAGVSNLYRG